MSEVLIPEKALAGLDETVRRLSATRAESYAVDQDDELYGTAFQRYLLFAQWPSVLTEAGLHLSKEEVLYNSYYWILKFAKLHALKHGYDAGIEQQVFKVLEQAYCDVDWSVVEQISNLVEKEIGEPGNSEADGFHRRPPP
jgi:hypothetical protein